MEKRDLVNQNLFPYLMAITVILYSTSSQAQLSHKDISYDYKSATIHFDPLLRKIEKPQKMQTKLYNTFKYIHQAEIDNSRGGYYYRGKMFCNYTEVPAEAEVSIFSNFSGLQSATGVKDEPIPITVSGTSNTINGYIRNYALVYPVKIDIYNKEVLIKTVEFFTASMPLSFRLTKELVEPSMTSNGNPFNSLDELKGYEASGKINKAAEKFAYFEALKKVDEIIKNCYGSFDYDFEIGTISVKKKKNDDYEDINQAVDLLEQGIKAYTSNNIALKDSLVKNALDQFNTISSSTEERVNKMARETILFNVVVCHALLGDLTKASEELAKYRSSDIGRWKTNSVSSLSYFIGINYFRSKLKSDKELRL